MPKRNFTLRSKQNEIKRLKKPQILQLIKDNDDNYKKVKILKKQDLIDYTIKQNYNGMFDNTLEENMYEHNLYKRIEKTAMYNIN